MCEAEKDLEAYKKICTQLNIKLAHHVKALRKVQGADNLKDCHRIAEQILNGDKE